MLLFSRLVVSDPFVTPWTVAHQVPLSMRFSRQDTGVSGHFLLQKVFPTQGSNPSLLHCGLILYRVLRDLVSYHFVV